MDSQAGRASIARLAESFDVSRSRAQTVQDLALLSKETVQLSGQGRGGIGARGSARNVLENSPRSFKVTVDNHQFEPKWTAASIASIASIAGRSPRRTKSTDGHRSGRAH
jgi:hypothetical protein